MNSIFDFSFPDIFTLAVDHENQEATPDHQLEVANDAMIHHANVRVSGKVSVQVSVQVNVPVNVAVLGVATERVDFKDTFHLILPTENTYYNFMTSSSCIRNIQYFISFYASFSIHIHFFCVWKQPQSWKQ